MLSDKEHRYHAEWHRLRPGCSAFFEEQALLLHEIEYNR
jgi:hypothetical protein